MKTFKQHSNPSHKRKKSNAEHDDDGGNSRAEEYKHQGKQNSGDNHSRKQKSKTRPPDSSAPSSPKDTSESNKDLDKILTTVTFDSKRMKDALEELQGYLNQPLKDRSHTSMSDMRCAGYTFQTMESLEAFVEEQFSDHKDNFTLSNQTWEYKILVAHIVTNMYKQLKSKGLKVVKAYNKLIFGDGKPKDHINGVKILCDVWMKEAVTLFHMVEKDVNSRHTILEIHPLKMSLIADYLLEYCNFCLDCTAIKNKQALEIIKTSKKWGIDFLRDVAITSQIAFALQNGNLIHACQGVRNKFHSIVNDEQHLALPSSTQKQVHDKSASSPPDFSMDKVPEFDYIRAGREMRLQKLRGKPIASTCRAVRRIVNWGSRRPVWHATSWDYCKDCGHNQTDTEDEDIHQWIISRHRTKYSLWGNSYERSMNELANSQTKKAPLAHELSNGLHVTN